MAEKNTNEIYSTLSKLREKYSDSDDLQRIDADYTRIKTLLKTKGLVENEVIQELIATCRRDILFARTRLSSDKSLLGDEKVQRELWFIIEAREWFIKIVSKDFDGELETMQMELQAELDR